MIERLIRKLSLYGPLPPASLDALAAAFDPPRAYDAGQDLVRQHAEPTESIVVLRGLAGRRVVLADGAQQLTAFQVAGDFVDLHGFVLRRLDHSVVALSSVQAAAIRHERLGPLTDRWPELTRALWFLTMIDAAIHRQWLTAVGRQDALARMAHLLCEMWARNEDVGLTERRSYRLPLTQAQLADALCLSTVHVNRTLQALRARGLMNFRSGVVDILDWPRLCDLASFDPTYLQMQVRPPPP